MTDLALLARLKALQAEAYSPRCIRILKEYLEARRHVGTINMAVLEAFADGRKTALKDLARGLARVNPGDPGLPLIHAAIQQSTGKTTTGAGKGMAPIYSIPLSEVDDDLIHLVETAGRAAKDKREMLYTLRQVLGAARRAGLAEEFSETSIAVHLAGIKLRKITAKTRKAQLGRLYKLSSAHSLSKGFMEKLKAELSAARLESSAQPSIRMQSYLNNPVSTIEVMRFAAQVSDEAANAVLAAEGRQTIHRLYITAGILAFVSYLPERISDIRSLVIGQGITRDVFGWKLCATSQKSEQDRSLDYFPDRLTPYLDDLVLLGSDPGPRSETLMRLLDQRAQMQSPLFARTDLKRAYSGTRLFQLIKERTGHGPHAFRKASTDDLVALGASEGEIMVHLGHRSPKTAPNSYEGLADKIRRQAAMKNLESEREDGPSKITTPSGRSFDLKAIGISLTRATNTTG